MTASLLILQDDMLKLWSEIEMSQISLAVGILFCILILKMSLQTIDRRDFMTELLYVTYITLVTLTLLVVVPDTMRPRSSKETILIVTVASVFGAMLRWNIVGTKPKSKELKQ